MTGHTMFVKVKKLGHLLRCPIRMTRIWEATLRISQFVEERMAHGINRREALRRGILEQGRNQINGFGRRFPKHLKPPG